MEQINVEIEKIILSKFFPPDRIMLYTNTVNKYNSGTPYSPSEDDVKKLEAMDSVIIHLSTLSNNSYLN